MANRNARLITKQTSVPGRIPSGTTGDESNLIKQGELAINTADYKLFSFDGSETFELGSKTYLNKSGGTVGDLTVTGSTSLQDVNATLISSGGTNLYDIFVTDSGSNDITRVQPGSNVVTGGTGNFPEVSVVSSPSFENMQISGTGEFNSLSATTLSAGTIISDSKLDNVSAGTNVFIDYSNPLVPVISSNSTTTAGVFSRVFFTADEITLGTGNYYFANREGSGTGATVQQTISVGGNSSDYFSQDLIGEAYSRETIIHNGDLAGAISVGASNSVGVKFIFDAELYLCENDGTPVNSGIPGQPNGDLGVQLITTATTGEISIGVTITEIQSFFNAKLTSDLVIPENHRIRYHFKGTKVGGNIGNSTLSFYHGTDHSGYLDIPLEITTDDVYNESSVSGNTTTDALNWLNSNKAGEIEAGSNLSSTGTIESPILNLEDSISIDNVTVSGTGEFSGITSGGTDLGEIFMPTEIYDSNGNGIVDKSSQVIFKAELTQTVVKGRLVYAQGRNVSTGVVQVALADNTVSFADKPVGMCLEGGVSGDIVEVVRSGAIEGIDTSLYPVGETLYLSTFGTYDTKGNITSGVYNPVAYVVTSNFTSGALVVDTVASESLNNDNIQNISNVSGRTTADALNWLLDNSSTGSTVDVNAVHVNESDEINQISEKNTPTSGDYLIIEDGSDSFNKKKVNISNLPTGGGGEANTASNIGNGNPIFKEKNGIDLEFRSLSAGTNVTITTGDTITINASGGGGSSDEFMSLPFSLEGGITVGKILNPGSASDTGWAIPFDCEITDVFVFYNLLNASFTTNNITLSLREVTPGVQISSGAGTEKVSISKDNSPTGYSQVFSLTSIGQTLTGGNFIIITLPTPPTFITCDKVTVNVVLKKL